MANIRFNARHGLSVGSTPIDVVDSSGLVSVSSVPGLDAAKITSGIIDAARLPSFVEDVLEFANEDVFPVPGETGKIYVALDTNKVYRWSGSTYVQITSGAVDSVAGKTGIVTLVKGDVGLGNADNTADSAKSVATAATLTTARTLTIGSTGKTFNGSANVAWSLAEIGAQAAGNFQAAGNYLTTDTNQTISSIKTTNNGIDGLLVGGLTSTSSFAPNINSFAAQPFSELWHDLFAFLRFYPTTFETSDGTTFSSATLNRELFAQKENQSIQVINGTSILAARWTFSSTAFGGARWLVIGHSFSTPAPNKTVLVESSADGGVSYTTRHQSTYTTIMQNVYHRLNEYGGDAQIRVTITWLSGSTINLSMIRLLTSRPGDQGRGKENQLPFTWNGDQDVTIGRDLSANRLTSTVATGTAPLTVSSTTRVANLNAATAGNADSVTNGVLTVGNQTIGGIKTFSSAPAIIATPAQSYGGLSSTLLVRDSTAAAANVGGVIGFGNGTLGTGGVGAFNEGTGQGGYLSLLYRPTTGSITEGLRINSSGNVGIGTTIPTFRLVAANSGTDGGFLYSTGPVSVLGLGGYSSGVNGAFSLRYDRASGNITFNGGTRDTPVERMRIAGGNGFVGIGTAASVSILETQQNTTSTTDFTITNSNTGNNITKASRIRFRLTDSVGTRKDVAYITALPNNLDSSTGGYLTFSTRTADSSPAEKMRILANGNVGIGTTTPGFKLEVNGSFAATTKSFVIPHPTKKGKKLRYGSLEGPENGIYIRGKLKDTDTIELPDYWTKLVDPDSITVTLTPIGTHQKLYVKDVCSNTVTVGNENLLDKTINCYYVVYAERCDVEKLEVEIDVS